MYLMEKTVNSVGIHYKVPSALVSGDALTTMELSDHFYPQTLGSTEASTRLACNASSEVLHVCRYREVVEKLRDISVQSRQLTESDGVEGLQGFSFFSSGNSGKSNDYQPVRIGVVSSVRQCQWIQVRIEY